MGYRDVDKSNTSIRFFEKKLLLAIIIILVAGIISAVWFIFVSDTKISLQKTENNVLPPDCYSVNGNITCPKR